MAKLSAHGRELTRFFSPKYRRLMAVMEDGTTLSRSIYGGWKIHTTKKKDVPLEQWRVGKLEAISKLPSWCLSIKSIPSLETLEWWACDGISETPTGDRVEPDGRGPDGVPSWCILLGVI